MIEETPTRNMLDREIFKLSIHYPSVELPVVIGVNQARDQPASDPAPSCTTFEFVWNVQRSVHSREAAIDCLHELHLHFAPLLSSTVLHVCRFGSCLVVPQVMGAADKILTIAVFGTGSFLLGLAAQWAFKVSKRVRRAKVTSHRREDINLAVCADCRLPGAPRSVTR